MIIIRPKPCAICGIVFQPTGNKGHCCSPTCTLQYLSKQDGECRVWTGSINGKGYGGIRINGKQYKAHRVSYEIKFGPIPEGMLALHKCDNRMCINPDHIFPGTSKENTADMIAKGRDVRGEACSWSKLTDQQVNEIRDKISVGKRGVLKALAIEYGVSQSTISDIKRRRKKRPE